MEKPKIVFFRSADLPSDFQDSLSTKFSIFTVPVLSFNFESFSCNLHSVDFSKYDCVVFPSPRSVEAVYISSISLSNVLICAVGESTSQLIESKLGLTPWLVGSKGAKSLAESIIKSGKVNHLAYLAGDNQATLPFEDFQKAGIEVTEITCYGTQEITQEELQSCCRIVPVPDICVFFSPSGVKTVASKLDWPWGLISLISIGTTTQAALLEILGKCDGIPNEFNLAGIKDLLLSKF